GPAAMRRSTVGGTGGGNFWAMNVPSQTMGNAPAAASQMREEIPVVARTRTRRAAALRKKTLTSVARTMTWVKGWRYICQMIGGPAVENSPPMTPPARPVAMNEAVPLRWDCGWGWPSIWRDAKTISAPSISASAESALVAR